MDVFANSIDRLWFMLLTAELLQMDFFSEMPCKWGAIETIQNLSDWVYFTIV